MSQGPEKSVQVVAEEGNWLVRVQEESGVSEVSYEMEEHARSYAAGQAIRLGVESVDRDEPDA